MNLTKDEIDMITWYRRAKKHIAVDAHPDYPKNYYQFLAKADIGGMEVEFQLRAYSDPDEFLRNRKDLREVVFNTEPSTVQPG